MKKNVLALSIAAMIGGLGFAGAASAAVTVNAKGEGQMLVLPYYTVQNGNSTAFQITNTDTTKAKAVKVRFRGGFNSDDILDFQVFLSPGDVWAAQIAKDADGLARLFTSDTSCTLPAKMNERKDGIPFVTTRLSNKNWDDAAKKAQTLEGYVEVIQMADIENVSGNLVKRDGTTANRNLFQNIKHVNGVAPCGSFIADELVKLKTASLLDLATANAPVVAPAEPVVTDLGLRAPEVGTLSGSWYVIDVANSTTFSGELVALNNDAVNRAIYSPQSTAALADGNLSTDEFLGTADPLIRTLAPVAPATTVKPDFVNTQFFDLPDLSTSFTVAQNVATGLNTAADTAVGLVSGAMSTASVANQFLAVGGLNASTDWVLSMPSRRYYVAANYGADKYTKVAADKYVIEGVTTHAVLKRDVISVDTAGRICVPTAASGVTMRDREETMITGSEIDFSPGTAAGRLNVCGEVSVLSFLPAGMAAQSDVTGAQISWSKVADLKFEQGWAAATFDSGVPVLASAFLKAKNGAAAQGTVGNYGVTWKHVSK
ncbi:cell surface protein [Delftia acidovorans]|uniref:cell surface protein n=1 Tax=Delftia acidovorans TaxID=80866 RepID=UPI0028AF6E2C|nr:cell surface protein [Delftia acidovorans]